MTGVTRDQLIVVDARNRAIGRAGKLDGHAKGLLHRAFSICLFDREGRMLLQQRHPAKYHSGGLWANSCCGHPRPGERTHSGARRRLQEELGTSATLRFAFRTHYCTTFPGGLSENEIVYVFFGLAPDALAPNAEEVSAVAYRKLPDLKRDIQRRPAAYAVWLRHYVINHYDLIRRGRDAVLTDFRR
ncbi:MAG TPA: isopentenyl-diphosphate Delta-isomerase [Opitutaceae bacterium]|nr:isopentenyl-diphosphate Delta-isomerase [Opitutaceae bacterium]